MTLTRDETGPGLLLPPAVVPDLLRRSARLVPDRPAVVLDGGRGLTFAELDSRSDAAARGLASHGVQRGDRVALLFGGDDWPEYVVAYFAVLKLGAVALIVGDRFTEDDLQLLAGRYQVAGCVRGAARPAPDLPCRVIAEVGDLETGHAGDPVGIDPLRIEAEPDDPAEVVFTSGTTARPRGVEARHANLVRARTAWPTDVRGNSPCVHALPIGSVAAQVVLLNCIGGQQTLHVMSRFDVAAFGRLVESSQATSVCLVPAMGHWLVRADRADLAPMPSVRGVSFSGAALPVTIMSDLPALFPAATFYNFYTSTEAYPARLATRYDPAQPTSVGVPAGSCEVRITDEHGTPLPDGETGQVWLRAAGAPARRFLDGGDADERSGADSTFADGWTRTGDLGRLDEQGRLCLAGRASDVVIVGGFNVSAFRVEDVLCRHEAVAEAAVFGAHHDVLGEVVAALVVLRSDATVRDLRRHAAGHLSRRELPAVLRIVDELPYNAAGKVDKRRLPEMLEASGPAAFVAPRTDVEQAVAAIWAEVLDLGSVGVEDNFFEIGGDSLAATSIAAAVRQRLGLDVDAVAVFEAPTVTEFVAGLTGSPTERNPC